MPGTNIAYSTRRDIFVARHGSRRDRAPVRPAGMSAVTSPSSAYVRDAYTRSTRASSSSLVSRPCTNATFRVPITCSRSAWDARSPPRPRPSAAAGTSPGPAISLGSAITAPPHQRDAGKRNSRTVRCLSPQGPDQVVPGASLSRAISRVGGRLDPVAAAVGQRPYHDARLRLIESPALHLFGPVMAAAQRGEVAFARPPALVIGHGVVLIATSRRAAAAGEGTGPVPDPD